MTLRGWEGEQDESSDSRREHVEVMGGKAGTLYFHQILEKKRGKYAVEITH